MAIGIGDTLNLRDLTAPELPPPGSLAFYQSGGEPKLVDSAGEEVLFHGAQTIRDGDGTEYPRRAILELSGGGVKSITDASDATLVEISGGGGGPGQIASNCVAAICESAIVLEGSSLTIGAPFTLSFANGRDPETGALESKEISLLEGGRSVDLAPNVGENRILFLGLLDGDVPGDLFVIAADRYAISNGTPSTSYAVWYDPGANLVTVPNTDLVSAVPILQFDSIESAGTVASWNVYYPPRLGNGICLKYHF